MKNLFIGMTLCLAANLTAFEAENGFGLGFVLGSPSGVSGSLPLGETNAINAVVGYDVAGDANIFLQGDYVWIQSGLIPVESGKVSVYYGPGAFARLARDAAVGIRGVVGIDYRFENAPLQIFLEVGPGINLIPDTRANAGGGLGIRYYF